MGEPLKGWRFVPEEPTAEMMQVGYERGARGEYNESIWKAMLAVAPTAAPLGYALVEIATINELCERIKGLIVAGSADARSIADVATLLLVATLPRG